MEQQQQRNGTTPPSLVVANFSIVIPPPISTAVPTDADLQRDSCFLEDFRNGFLSRGVPFSMIEQVTQQRHDLIRQIKSALYQFVVDVNNKNGFSFSNSLLWADVRPYGSVAIEADLIDSDADLYRNSSRLPKTQKQNNLWRKFKKKKKFFFLNQRPTFSLFFFLVF